MFEIYGLTKSDKKKLKKILSNNFRKDILKNKLSQTAQKSRFFNLLLFYISNYIHQKSNKPTNRVK